MKTGKIAALVVAALVAGLALGTVGTAIAAPAAAANVSNGFGAMCRQAGGTIAEIVAKVTGQSVADVQAARATGDSFADIAAAKGVAASALTDEVIAARKAALDEAVKAGTLTQDQADAMLANMTARVSAKIAADAPEGCTGTGAGSGTCAGGGQGGGRGSGGGCGGGMMGGAGCPVATPAQ